MLYIILSVLIYMALLNIQALDKFENSFSTKINSMSISRSPEIFPLQVSRNEDSVRNTKSIILWNKPYAPVARMFNSMIHLCPVNNCVLHKKRYFDNISQFDAIIISENSKWFNYTIPSSRSTKQKYIYLVIESTSYFSFTNAYNGIFNWIMSYRMASDIKLPYISIYDKAGILIGPEENINWKQKMKDLSERQKAKLKSKTKLGAIFVSNCQPTYRLNIVEQMNQYLRKYNLNIDVFGKCGMKKCDKNNSISCDAMLERDYFFYLSFENSFAVDYVTEKLTRAVHTHTVPVVLGGADYSRFMPPGSYINACDRDPAELVRTLVRVMSNWTRYFEYFRFTNHYDYFDMENKSTFACDLCKMLNDKILMKNRSRYNDLDKWYNQDSNTTCQK